MEGPTTQVGDFKVLLNQQIGRGGFGDVYKALDQKDSTVAAKRINLQAHPGADIKEAIGFYNRPPEHENLIKLYDIQRTATDFWVFMEYCPYGDLDNYFISHFDCLLGMKQKILLMCQIACGIAYLHSQDIVHRDIKPANILVTGSHIPEDTILRITDLGLAKYLDPNANTSRMSSNLGTEHFKAPEFWLPGLDGRICYHRNVDTFATGLTFQAMLQATPKRRLTPALENTLDPITEGRMPIGQVMVYRQKLRQTSVDPIADKKDDNSLTCAVKQLIRRMILMVPEHRILMQEVHRVLSAEQPLLQQVFPSVTLDKVKTFPTQLIDWGLTKFVITDEVEVIVYGTSRTGSDSFPLIYEYNQDGDLLKTWQPPQCRHTAAPDRASNPCHAIPIEGVLYLAAACPRCKSIEVCKTSNDAENDTWITAYRGTDQEHSFSNICSGKGPTDTVLAVGRRGQNELEIIVFDCTSTFFTVKDVIPTENILIMFAAYFESGYQGGFIIGSNWKQKIICAFSLRDKQFVWKLHGEVMGKAIYPLGMCTDDKGRLYVADGPNERILVLDANTGHVLQVKTPEVGTIVDVAWSNTQSLLTVCHIPIKGRNYEVTCYNVTWESNVD